MSRRLARSVGRSLAVGAVAAAVLAAAGCGADKQSGSIAAGGTTTVTLGEVGPAITVLPDYVAEAKGFYTSHGIAIKRVTIANVQAAMISGDVDVANSTIDSAITAANAGRTLPALLAYQQHGLQNLMVRKDLDAPALHGNYPASVEALPRPLSVGLVIRGSSGDVLLKSVMGGAGRKEGSDFKPVVIGGGPNIVAALKAKQIDAAVLFPPFDAIAELEGIAVSVASEAAGEGPRELIARYGGALDASPAWVDKNPDVARRLVAALVEAEQYIHDAYADGDAAKQAELLTIAQKYTGIQHEEAAKRSLATMARITDPRIMCERVTQQVELLASVVPGLSVPGCGDVILRDYVPADGLE